MNGYHVINRIFDNGSKFFEAKNLKQGNKKNEYLSIRLRLK